MSLPYLGERGWKTGSLRLALALFASFLVLMITPSYASAISEDFSYDANGNLIQDATYYYSYNDANQLSKVCRDSECSDVAAEYTYDYQGQRVKKVENESITTYYIGDYYETVVGGDEQGDTAYYFANNERVAENKSGVKRYYSGDHLGSTNIVTDENGNLVEWSSYYPFGDAKAGGTESKFLYTGKEKEDIGLYYYGARYYMPRVRRWTQPDVIIPNVYNPQSLDRYSYVLNNPIRLVDPHGYYANKEDAEDRDYLEDLYEGSEGSSRAYRAWTHLKIFIRHAIVQEGIKEGLKTVKEKTGIDLTDISLDAKYINTGEYGWTDTWHFSGGGLLRSLGLSNEDVIKIGEAVETAQESIDHVSAWSGEDQTSVRAGAEFEEYSQEGGGMSSFLTEKGATNAVDAPDWACLPYKDFGDKPPTTNRDAYTVVYIDCSNPQYSSSTEDEGR